MEQYAYVNGSVLSGAGEEDDVFIDIAFEEEYFNATAVEKYNLMQNGSFDRENGISDGETFALSLSIESLMGNISYTKTVYIKIEELYDNGTVQYNLQSSEFYTVNIPFIDSDGDGVTDEDDAFPNDANETDDSECNYDVYDADGDSTVVNVTWLVNGVVINVDWQSDTLSSAFEDEVECSVTASDNCKP